jgi:hypothetical protein
MISVEVSQISRSLVKDALCTAKAFVIKCLEFYLTPSGFGRRVKADKRT